MTLKKLLAVLLVAAAMLGVMATVAISSHARAQAAVVADEVPSTDGTDPDEPVDMDFWWSLSTWWTDFFPRFQIYWNGGFGIISKLLVWGFQLLLLVTGLWR